MRIGRTVEGERVHLVRTRIGRTYVERAEQDSTVD